MVKFKLHYETIHTDNRTHPKILLLVGILILMTLPLSLLFTPDFVWAHSDTLYTIVHITLLFVMLIRPLADIFTSTRLIRPSSPSEKVLE